MKTEVLTEEQKFLLESAPAFPAQVGRVIAELIDRVAAAEDIVDRSLAHFPEKKLRALAHGYRISFPKASGLEVETDG